MKLSLDPHHGHPFPTEIISHAVWLYHLFSLGLRNVELIVAERRVLVSYETVRRWSKTFATSFASRPSWSPRATMASSQVMSDNNQLEQDHRDIKGATSRCAV